MERVMGLLLGEENGKWEMEKASRLYAKNK
jgi:hypothetical protein